MEFKHNNLEHINSTFTVTKAKELPDGQFEAVLSTDDLDRHGEIVSIKGLVIPKNQVIKMYYNHQTSGDKLPIGQWSKIWKSKEGKLMGRGQIDLLDEFEVKIDKKIKLGTLDSISIGFYPQEFDGDTGTWTKSLLVEASVVAEPANTNARVTQKELGFTEEEFSEALKVRLKDAVVEEPQEAEEVEEPEVVAEPDNSEILSTEDIGGQDSGKPDQEVKAAIDELKSRIGAVEQAHKEATENPAMVKTIRVRLAAKQVDQAAEHLNRVIKVKLKETK